MYKPGQNQRRVVKWFKVNTLKSRITKQTIRLLDGQFDNQTGLTAQHINV